MNPQSQQATKQNQSLVTKSQSLVLMKNMIRISLSSICYMRDLFPTSCYKNQQYGSIEIHQLRGAEKDDIGEVIVNNQEAFLLTQWIEKGIFSALESEYLQSVTFAIFSYHPITNESIVLETYEFKVSYQNQNGSASINGASMFSKESLKQQAGKFIRSLTEFTSTLDELPSDRWITIQLKYQDETPVDYEPEYFKSHDGSLFGSQSMPLKVKLGNIKTPHMEINAKFAGLESLLFEDLCKVPKVNDVGNHSLSTPTIFRGSKGKDGESSFNKLDESSIMTNPIPFLNTTVESENLSIKATEVTDEEIVRCVIEQVEKHGKANAKPISEKLTMNKFELSERLDKLSQSGKLKKINRFSYTTVDTVLNNKIEQSSNKETKLFHHDSIVDFKGESLENSLNNCEYIQPEPIDDGFEDEFNNKSSISSRRYLDKPPLALEEQPVKSTTATSKSVKSTKKTSTKENCATSTPVRIGAVGFNDETSDTFTETELVEVHTLETKRKVAHEQQHSLSQSSDASDTSQHKRRKYSIIKDPLHLKKNLSQDMSNDY
eukprot:gene4772-6694_t